MINPFIIATNNVIGIMAHLTAKLGKPYLKKDDIAKGDVTGIIGITGETNGTISVTFDSESILTIVSNMFGEEITEIDDDVIDAVGELTNMISGQARKELEKVGIIFQAAIPSVISGKNHRIVHIAKGQKIAIPFSIANGKFTIEVCLEK